MKKACQLDQTLQLPPIGTRVALVDEVNIVDGAGPTGEVAGYGTITAAGSIVHPTTPLVPVVIVRLDKGLYLETEDHQGPVYVQDITVHPDNLLTDEVGRWVEAL